MQGLRFMDLERGLSELSKYICFTKFGLVELYQMNFEYAYLINIELKRKGLFLNRGGHAGKHLGRPNYASARSERIRTEKNGEGHSTIW